ncbi:glycoside hydrolase family 2 protein [Treponema rectale]|uniref:Beta-galactosidase n=1 Tax=Treponema rectale TaxID=744512 RepID=A0A840S8L8_9SPIR|nr:glycoside hydrolase family 2 TIM barrel-domain containing protein [Treponema rectale]MBB5218007.1 beta-galactosidase [Treponema rectale]QOS40278.1 glycoside hydrolase family 2 protein [Treponema rectale]
MKNRIYLNNDWEFSDEFNEKMLSPKFKGKWESVRIPHSVTETPFNSFDESIYQKISLYRKSFKTETEWAGKRIILTVGAAAHMAEVYLNGEKLAEHKCGYTAFSVDLSDHLAPAGKANILAIKVDSRESLDIPPFGYVIDYMTYGGIYRDVYLDIKNPVYIQDVFVKTSSNHLESEITLEGGDVPEGYTVEQKVVSAASLGGEPSACITTAAAKKILTACDASPVVAWTLENPALYNLVTVLKNEKGKAVDTKTVRFGFRDIRFDETGFYLNNKKIKLRGLNRHQSYPYVGYAMPKNMQTDDADILKYELGLNYVRTSHYPQSHAFIDRCDELGLLVFTEIPGWQHIGGEKWQDQAVENVREMILEYRNHPSIFMWGVRINESQDNDALYTRTNELAHKLDSTRPTGGVRFLQHSHLLEDVYTFNDFVHEGNNRGTRLKKNVTDTKKGYLISEYNGHMYPTKTFDDERHRTEHAIRHANVLDSVAGDDEIAGSSGWCAFDYNTHKDFGSGDRICYHGVMDMFRNPKLAAYVYGIQQDNSVTGDILEITSSMDIGEYPGGTIDGIWILTNADSVKLYTGNTFIREYTSADSPYKNLKKGPIPLFDVIGNRLVDEDGVKPSHSEAIKELLRAAQKYGMEKIPFKYKLKFVKLLLCRAVTFKKLEKFYWKYMGSWGGSQSSHKFEAYKDGKIVKTVIKTPGKKTGIELSTRRTELLEEETYDAVCVNIRAKDEHFNLQPYCQEAVSLSVKGPIAIIGPSVVSLKGGMAGTYVKTLGRAGKAQLVVTDWQGNETYMNFTVKVKKI